MHYVRIDDSDLLRALHEGVLEQPLWSGFLEQLRGCIPALYTTLTLRAFPEGDPVALYAGQPPPMELQRLVAERYAQAALPFRLMRDDTIYSLDVLLDPNDPAQAKFYRSLFQGMGIDYIHFMQVTEPNGVRAWLSCAGRKKNEPSASAFLSKLAPHLRVALRTYVVLEQQRHRSAVTYEAVRRFNFGWLVLDARCRIVDLMPDVEQVLKCTNMLKRGRHDRLELASPHLGEEIAALVKRFAADPASRPHALTLSHDPWTDMLIAPVKDRATTARTKPVAIIYLRSDRQSQADRCDQLVELFGLLPSEARLAWAIVKGMSIAEAARYLEITVETARHYSKKVYAKTGTHGQAGLVRTVLTSVLSLD